MRVATFYAHEEAGALFPLPAGSEVRVGFENGDEARPYVEHTYFGGLHRPPRFRDGGTLPGNKYLAGIHLHEPGSRRFGEIVWDLTPNQINVQFGGQHGDSRLLLGSLSGKRFNGEGKPQGEGFLLHTVESGALHTGKCLLLQAEERPQGIGRQLDSSKHQDRLAEGLKLQQSLGQYAGEHQGLPTDDQPQGELLDDIKAAPGGSNTDPEGRGGKPTVSINGEAGIAVSTGKTLVHSAEVNIDTGAGMNLQLLSGRRTVLNAGKGLSMFAHADGIRCIAHHGPVIVQSQHDKTQVEAATDLTLTAIDGKPTEMPEFDFIKQTFNTPAVLGDMRAGTALTNVVLAIGYANHFGKNVLVAGTSDAEHPTAVMVTPPAKPRPIDPAKPWFRARGDSNAYLPWWGLRRDAQPREQGFSE